MVGPRFFLNFLLNLHPRIVVLACVYAAVDWALKANYLSIYLLVFCERYVDLGFSF